MTHEPPEGVSLRDYFDMRLTSLERSRVEAVDAMERRLEGMNELRAQLDRQAGTFLTMKEHDIFRERVDKELRNIAEFRAVVDTKASLNGLYISIALSVLGLLASLMGIIFTAIHLIRG